MAEIARLIIVTDRIGHGIDPMTRERVVNRGLGCRVGRHAVAHRQIDGFVDSSRVGWTNNTYVTGCLVSTTGQWPSVLLLLVSMMGPRARGVASALARSAVLVSGSSHQLPSRAHRLR